MTDELGPEIEKMLDLWDLDDWGEAVNEYLDRTPQPNVIFNHLAGRWLRQVVAPVLAPNLLQNTVELVEKWDGTHSPDRRHKGTPYYFLGMGYTLLGDIDRGFLYMHLAFREDQLSSGVPDPAQPAMRFVTVDASTDEQAFKDEVDRYADFLESRIERYRVATGGSLTLGAMRSKVIQRPDLWDDMFHLIYATARILRLESWGQVAKATTFGVNLLAQSLGDLCLVAEQWMRHGWPVSGEFFNHSVRYLGRTGYGASAQASMQAVSKATKDPATWGQAVHDLLDATFTSGTRLLDPRESDIAIAYVIRNSSSHRVKADSLLASRFEDIEARIYSAIFGIVEHLP